MTYVAWDEDEWLVIKTSNPRVLLKVKCKVAGLTYRNLSRG